MTILPIISEMTLVEYCDYLESTALYTGVDVNELNIENRFELGLIDDARYENAKWELVRRWRDREFFGHE